jgi:hypothetical protein
MLCGAVRLSTSNPKSVNHPLTIQNFGFPLCMKRYVVGSGRGNIMTHLSYKTSAIIDKLTVDINWQL